MDERNKMQYENNTRQTYMKDNDHTLHKHDQYGHCTDKEAAKVTTFVIVVAIVSFLVGFGVGYMVHKKYVLQDYPENQMQTSASRANMS